MYVVRASVCVCVSVLECSCVVALFLKFASGCNLEETQADIGALLSSQKMLFFNCENLVFYLAKQQIAWRLRKALRVPLCGSAFAVSLLYHIRVFVLPASLATPFSNMKSHVQLAPLTRTRSLSLALARCALLLYAFCVSFVLKRIANKEHNEYMKHSQSYCWTSANCALSSSSSHCLLKQQ